MCLTTHTCSNEALRKSSNTKALLCSRRGTLDRHTGKAAWEGGRGSPGVASMCHRMTSGLGLLVFQLWDNPFLLFLSPGVVYGSPSELTQWQFWMSRGKWVSCDGRGLSIKSSPWCPRHLLLRHYLFTFCLLPGNWELTVPKTVCHFETAQLLRHSLFTEVCFLKLWPCPLKADHFLSLLAMCTGEEQPSPSFLI